MISIRAKAGTVTLSLSAGLDRFKADKPRILREIGMSLLVGIRQGFKAERSPEGEAWEPLKPATVRQRKGDAHPILQRKGRLKKSVTLRLTPDSVVVGTNLAYAPIHQFGATIQREASPMTVRLRKWKGRIQFAKAKHKRVRVVDTVRKAHTVTIPARPYLFQRDGDIPDGWKRAMADIVKKHLRFDHA